MSDPHDGAVSQGVEHHPGGLLAGRKRQCVERRSRGGRRRFLQRKRHSDVGDEALRPAKTRTKPREHDGQLLGSLQRDRFVEPSAIGVQAPVGETLRVTSLKRVSPPPRTTGQRRQDNHASALGSCGLDAGKGIGQPRSSGREHDARTATGQLVLEGHEDRAGLMSGVDRCQSGLYQRGEQRNRGPAEDAECTTAPHADETFGKSGGQGARARVRLHALGWVFDHHFVLRSDPAAQRQHGSP